jgi:hypothetical protein
LRKQKNFPNCERRTERSLRCVLVAQKFFSFFRAKNITEPDAKKEKKNKVELYESKSEAKIFIRWTRGLLFIKKKKKKKNNTIVKKKKKRKTSNSSDFSILFYFSC